VNSTGWRTTSQDGGFLWFFRTLDEAELVAGRNAQPFRREATVARDDSTKLGILLAGDEDGLRQQGRSAAQVHLLLDPGGAFTGKPVQLQAVSESTIRVRACQSS